MIDLLLRFSIPAAYAVLPAAMASPAATAMLLAIALQESKGEHRRQIDGPARSFWQFERAGLTGIRRHAATKAPLQVALEALQYPPVATTEKIYVAIEHNDVLAAVCARLLLWTLPVAIPDAINPDLAWQQYLRAWRPGRPHKVTWAEYYAHAWTLATR